MSTERRVFLTKNNQIALLAFSLLGKGTVIGVYDGRNKNPISRCFAEFGDENARSFDGQIEKSVKNGWKIAIETGPNNYILS